MKNYIYKTFATVVMLLFTLGAMAENEYSVTYMIDKEIVEEGSENTPGIVEYSYADGIGTITVKPADGYYLTAENLTVVKTIDGSNAQTRSVTVAGNVTIAATDADADPSGETTYTFSVNSTKYDYEITADFQVRVDISDYQVTLEKTTETYTGSAITPTISSVSLDGGTALTDKDYTVSYQQGENTVESMTDAGSYIVVVTGARTHTGTAAAEFVIENADMTVTAEGYEGDYDATAHSITVNAPEGATILYGEKDGTYDLEANPEYKDVGTHTVYYQVTKDNYNLVEGSAKVVISLTEAPEITFDEASGQEYATFYSADRNYSIPTGKSAYIVTGVNGNEVTILQVSFIMKGFPVLIQNASGGDVEETTPEVFEQSILQISPEGGIESDGSQYVLFLNEYVEATGNIPENKCYLKITGNTAGTRSFKIGNPGDGTTAISSTVSNTNGEEEWYDLQGRRIQKPTKGGLYILNGKKIIIEN